MSLKFKLVWYLSNCSRRLLTLSLPELSKKISLEASENAFRVKSLITQKYYAIKNLIVEL